MKHVKRLTSAHLDSRTENKLNPPKTHTYQPQTRIEKLSYNQDKFPQSTDRKIIFVSNQYGNGFKRQELFNRWPEVNIEEMKRQVDAVCYQTWSKYRQNMEKNLFEVHSTFINVLCFLVTVVMVIYVMFINGPSLGDSAYLTFGVACAIIAGALLFYALFIFLRKNKTEHYDTAMIHAIKQKLYSLNTTEKELTAGQPRFEWSCNRDCLWIAVTISEWVDERY